MKLLLQYPSYQNSLFRKLTGQFFSFLCTVAQKKVFDLWPKMSKPFLWAIRRTLVTSQTLKKEGQPDNFFCWNFYLARTKNPFFPLLAFGGLLVNGYPFVWPHTVGKLQKMSHFNFWILAFSTNFCPIKRDLSGNSVWPQALGFQKLAKMTNFWHF